MAFDHFPALETAGIKQVINGPFTFAPDGNPLVGPVRGLRNFWVACGVMAGFSQGGGVGLALANWIVRKSVVEGKSVSVRVDLGGRRIIKNKKQQKEWRKM